VELFGKENILDTIKKYPKIFDEYLKLFATKKYETITWMNK